MQVTKMKKREETIQCRNDEPYETTTTEPLSKASPPHNAEQEVASIVKKHA